MYKIFIDGQEGTTGLKIFERFKDRNDFEILKIDDRDRKNLDKRLEYIEKADITFLCLPDDAAKEIAKLAPENAKIIDTSTAHRTDDKWVYGMPELEADARAKIRNAFRVASPGCHATGFILSLRPLTDNGIVPKDHAFSCTSITGYSGGGKRLIKKYHEGNFTAPQQYAQGQMHKHLPEMKKMAKIDRYPIFTPVVANYYSGMQVIVPLEKTIMKEAIGIKGLTEIYKDRYSDSKMIEVLEMSPEVMDMIPSDYMSGSNRLMLWVSGNDERFCINTLYDNLGKGASGAAVQCMNIMLGISEEEGLL